MHERVRKREKERGKARKQIPLHPVGPKGRLLSELTGKENCKLAAVRDEGLAKAILSCAEDEFIKYPGGNG